MHMHAQTGVKVDMFFPMPTPHPHFHFSFHGTHLHAIYINACPHAKLLAKEPQPGHAVEEAVVELGRKGFRMHVQGLSVDGESPPPLYNC